MTYDLRRLRIHGLIQRIPHSRRYRITDTGLHHPLLFTHAHDHLLRTGLAELADPDPPWPSQLRAASRAYQRAFNKLASHAHLAASPRTGTGDNSTITLDSIMTAPPFKPFTRLRVAVRPRAEAQRAYSDRLQAMLAE